MLLEAIGTCGRLLLPLLRCLSFVVVFPFVFVLFPLLPFFSTIDKSLRRREADVGYGLCLSLPLRL